MTMFHMLVKVSRKREHDEGRSKISTFKKKQMELLNMKNTILQRKNIYTESKADYIVQRKSQ